MGRKPKPIDPDQVKKLASIGLSNAEIGAVIDCSPDTIERRFKGMMKAGREHRNASVRRKQFEVAIAGNPTMLIWLGKQYLGQSDKIGLSTPDGPLQVQVDRAEIVGKLLGTRQIEQSVTSE